MRDFLLITKALSDESRVRALLCLEQHELCLCQIIEVLGLAPATVSKHMNVLYHAGLVDKRKQGKWHFYRLASDDGHAGAGGALAWALQALAKNPTVREDARRVRRVARRDPETSSACYRS